MSRTKVRQEYTSKGGQSDANFRPRRELGRPQRNKQYITLGLVDFSNLRQHTYDELIL